MRFVAKYTWQLLKATEKRSIPEVSVQLKLNTEKPFIADRIHGAYFYFHKIGSTIKSFVEILATRFSRCRTRRISRVAIRRRRCRDMRHAYNFGSFDARNWCL